MCTTAGHPAGPQDSGLAPWGQMQTSGTLSYLVSMEGATIMTFLKVHHEEDIYLCFLAAWPPSLTQGRGLLYSGVSLPNPQHRRVTPVHTRTRRDRSTWLWDVDRECSDPVRDTPCRADSVVRLGKLMSMRL